jgi:hypothetical protein
MFASQSIRTPAANRRDAEKAALECLRTLMKTHKTRTI